MYKRLLVILPLLLLSISGFAQLQKGNKILGGTLNYTTSKSTSDDIGVAAGQSDNSSSFVNRANLGVFVSDRTVLGMNFEISTYTSEQALLAGSAINYDSNQFGFGPFVRRYFPVKEWVAFYGQAGLGYNFGNVKQVYDNPNLANQGYEIDIKTLSLSTGLGLAFFPTDWMSVDLAMNPLSYVHQILDSETPTTAFEKKTNIFNFNLSTQSISVGAHFFFKKK